MRGRVRHQVGRGVLVLTLAAFGVVGLTSTSSAHLSTTTLHGDTEVVVSHLGPTSFSGPGPFAVGETTLSIPVPAEGYSTTAEVWYPAQLTHSADDTYDAGEWLPPPLLGDFQADSALVATTTASTHGVLGAAPATGRFPLVLFSHGWAGFRDQSSFLTSHLASWGFVVVAPDDPDDDLTEVIGSYLSIPPPSTDPYAKVADLLATVSAVQSLSSGPLLGHVDASQFIVVGHSAGGETAEELASDETVASATAHVANPDVGFVALAGTSTAGLSPPLPEPYQTIPATKAVVMKAADDLVVPGFYMNATYNELTSPHVLVSLAKSGHLVFSDTCQTVPTTGVLPAILTGLKIPIPSSFRTGISDGCAKPDVAVTKQWPVIDQVVVASARWMFGEDTTTKGLVGLTSAFRGLVNLNTTGHVN